MSLSIFTISIFFQLIIATNLISPLVIFILGTLRKTKYSLSIPQRERDFAVIVTAFEQTDFLNDTIESILKMNYKNFLVYVVADKCDISGLNFSPEQVVLLQPPQVLQSNIGSHFYAIRNFRRNHTHLAIIDSDNLVHKNFLSEINKMLALGYQAVQGTRVPKNVHTSLAALDAARDIYYNYYDGEKLFAAGSSATLAGSGMAFTTSLYRSCVENVEIKGAGFDKVLQYKIVSRGEIIAFSKKAIVFDEKTSTGKQLIGQRSRWIRTWFKYYGFGAQLVKKGISGLNKNQLLFGLILLRPPLFLFLLASLLFVFINLWYSLFAAGLWVAGLFSFSFSFFIALKNADADKFIYHSLKKIPVFIFYQVLALFKMKVQKNFVATKHIYTKRQ